MTKKINVLILACFTAFFSYAEEGTSASSETVQPTTEIPKTATKPQSSMMDHLYFGGAIHLSFGDYTVIGVEPILGYRITPKLSAGVSARYDYIKDSRYTPTRETSQYGGSVFGRYRITDALYAQIEPASYNTEQFDTDGSSAGREWVPYLFMGAGYRQPLSERSWIYAQLLFDVLQDNKSPYDDWTPFLSIGIGAGL